MAFPEWPRSPSPPLFKRHQVTVHPLSHLTHDKKLSNLALRFYCQNLPDESKDTFACPPILHVSTGFIRNFCIAHNTLCLHVVLYNNFFPISLGCYSCSKTNWSPSLCKIFGGKQDALWTMRKWWMDIIHSMSDPEGNSSFCFPESPDVRTRGKTKLTGFSRDLTLSVLVYF